MNPLEFLHAANSLAKSSRPGHLRSAVSRAYYAAYHAGVALLNSMSIHVSRGASGHGELRTRFLNCDDEELVLIGSLLGDLHRQRILADYNLDRREVEQISTVSKTVDTAGELILRLTQYHNEPDWSEAKAELLRSI